ncbi:hypothetical protein Cob_v000788 [Colletotrichum orbiculare MAFF 240422]|uniref:Uncharacterized protein n=1 Tax=Colletotrichum orbiculare (strain 104-T / ATCC 96160 / CBS 514.97 / LARS 414 / MAFF 240422) TaxID=1213857 RepID=A0A484GAB6_COLOR|nr:hypothetical protein Cob_v000788 [Colletotrichum orbiculare MAFF 240422]
MLLLYVPHQLLPPLSFRSLSGLNSPATHDFRPTLIFDVQVYTAPASLTRTYLRPRLCGGFDLVAHPSLSNCTGVVLGAPASIHTSQHLPSGPAATPSYGYITNARVALLTFTLLHSGRRVPHNGIIYHSPAVPSLAVKGAVVAPDDLDPHQDGPVGFPGPPNLRPFCHPPAVLHLRPGRCSPRPARPEPLALACLLGSKPLRKQHTRRSALPCRQLIIPQPCGTSISRTIAR